MVEKINKIQNWLFEKINKIDKSLVKSIKKKKTQKYTYYWCQE